LEDQEMQEKIQKSKRYANESDRFKLLSIKTEMTSRHGSRLVSFNADNQDWECTCDFYQSRGTCSHIMALQQIMYNLFPKSNLGNNLKDE